MPGQSLPKWRKTNASARASRLTMSRVPWRATRDSLWVVYRSFRLDKICGADQLWNEGEKVLAHIHLALARLPTVILVIAPARNLVFHVLEFAAPPSL